jgi:hypothetical protein
VGGAISGFDSVLNSLRTMESKKNRRIRKEKLVSKVRIHVSIKNINTEISAKVEAIFEEIMH